MRHRLACVWLLLPALVAGSAEPDWTRFRGPNGTGVSGVVNLPNDLDPAKAGSSRRHDRDHRRL
jgi:hypothetical protein